MSNNQLKPFIARADARYTYRRALEELEGAEDEPDLAERDRMLVRAIQLINITRYKLKDAKDESVRTTINQEGRAGSDNPGETGGPTEST